MNNDSLRQKLKDVPAAYVERILKLCALFDSEDARFETDATKLLKKYKDQETGVVRDLLARWYLMNGKEDEGFALLEEMKAEEPVRYAAYMIEAQLASHQPSEALKAMELCDRIPFDNYYHVDSLILKAAVKERFGKIDDMLGELTENLALYKESKPQADYLTLLVNALAVTVDIGDMAEHDRLAEELIEVINTQDLEDETFFVNDVGSYCSHVNEHAWPREKFKQIADAMNQRNWLRDNPDFADKLLVTVELFDIWEDNRFNRPLCGLFQWIASEDEENEEWPIKWAAVTAYEKDPGILDYDWNKCPNISRIYLPEVKEILAHGKQVKKQAEAWVMEHEQADSRDEARNYLRGFMEFISTPIGSSEFEPHEFGIWCSEGFETVVRQTLALYFLNGYETAEVMARNCRNEIDDDDGFLQYIEIMSMIAQGKGKQALKRIESIKKESPEEFRTIHMEASALRYTRNYRKAGKVYAKAAELYEDQIHFIEGYIDVLGKLGKEDQVRTIVLDMLDEIDFFDEEIPGNVVSTAFYYVGHVILLMDDITNERRENFEEDTKNLKTLLLRKRPSGYPENEFARYITMLCQVVMDRPEYMPFFRELLQFMEKYRTFTLQDQIIESGYGACESILIREEKGLEESLILELTHFLHDQKHQEEYDLDLEMKIKEALWFAAETLRTSPTTAEELLERYPHYMKPAKPYLEEILEDPEAVKKDSEIYLADITGHSESVIREMLNEQYREFQEDNKSERTLLS